MRLPATTARRGVSLMESLVAVTILFLILAMLTQLTTATSRMLREVRQRSTGIQLAQSKMAEFTSGALPMSSQGGSFEEDPDWEWEVEASQHSVTGLWNVTVRVHRPDQD